MAVQISNFFVCSVQHYMLATLFCKVGKAKYSYKKHILISMVLMTCVYFVTNYGTMDVVSRIIAGLTCFMFNGFILYESNLTYRMIRGIGVYLIWIGLDFACQILFGDWLSVSLESMEMSISIVLARNIYNSIFYLFMTILEWRQKKKEGSNLVMVTYITMLSAIFQILAFYLLFVVNQQGLSENLIIMSVFYSGTAILGYFITMEMLTQFMSWQQRKAELEEKMLERQYQYDYYLLARKQGEGVRDLRHDMRNQLQTMQYLLATGGEEGKERAQGMLFALEKELETGWL